MKVKFSFIFQVSNYNGSMSIDIYEHDQLLYSGQNLDEGQLRVDVSVSWPSKLTIVVGNKQNSDVLINNQGTIVKHKYIEVVGLLINNFPLHINLLDRVFNCQRQDRSDITHENFWSFNGAITIDLDNENPMRYLLALNNQFDINRLTWNNNE